MTNAILLLPLLCLTAICIATADTDEKDIDDLICGIWFAKSTIPGAGLGIFAGTDFDEGKSVLPMGDVVVPLVDLAIHQKGAGKKVHFLWDEYTWDGAGLYMDHEGLDEELNAASAGFGAGVNCFMDLVNVKEGVPPSSNLGLHRLQDPGVGAFSYYWNRDSVASERIQAGNELFASYGSSWFTSREESMGPVPLKGDLKRANSVLKKYSKLEAVVLGATGMDDITSQKLQVVLQDLLETFAWDSPWSDTSRVLFALPKSWPETRKASNVTLSKLKREQHSVSVEWLEEHGACGDWITVAPSTIKQAGRGAFSRRSFVKGEEVAPFPLIHLPYRDYLDMFEISSKTGDYVADTDTKRSTQLLVNYCMGHNESTMLLCPYGTLSSHINHNQTRANVKMIWADPARSNHNPDWLNKPLKELYTTDYSGLSMTLVATQDIGIGEEVFLDYGNEWEDAWQEHVADWNPVKGAESYVAAEQLNSQTTIIQTEFELMHTPWPGNVDIKFNLAFRRPRRIWLKHWEQGKLGEYMTRIDEYYERVEVLRREVDTDNHTWYAVVVIEDEVIGESKKAEKKKEKLVLKVPREAFRFFDRPYTSDMHQDNAFRHDLRIPDELFPDLWKNIREGSSPSSVDDEDGTEPVSEPAMRSDDRSEL